MSSSVISVDLLDDHIVNIYVGILIVLLLLLSVLCIAIFQIDIVLLLFLIVLLSIRQETIVIFVMYNIGIRAVITFLSVD